MRLRFLLQGTKNHVQNYFLPRFMFVENSQAFTHRKAFMQILSIMRGEDDDMAFVHTFFDSVGKQFTSIQLGHFQVEQE